MKRILDSKEYKPILTDLLCEVDSFCGKNGIKYYLIGGTLLGAVRHKGFIPWDDDIDIGMFREDYERFLRSYTPSSPKYDLQYFGKSSHFLFPFAKLINTETELYENVRNAHKTGLWVDIFPLDNCPDRVEEQKKFVKSFGLLRAIMNFKTIKLSKNRSLVKNAILLVGRVLVCAIPARWAEKKIIKRAQKYSNEQTEYIGEIVLNPYGMREVYKKEAFNTPGELYFECRNFYVPENTDYVLTTTYGDYMQLPPEEKRVTHHDFVCYINEK